ncbi:MAG: site-specific integrase [Clostridia bacterium]
MSKKITESFTREQLELVAQQAAKLAMNGIFQPPNLDSGIDSASTDTFGEENPKVSTRRIQAKVQVNGQTRWVSGYSQQELFDNYVGLLEREGVIQWTGAKKQIPLLGDYLDTFVRTFKDGQASLTKQNRERIIRNHIMPKFGKRRINEITTTEIQQWYNELARDYSRETILKIRNSISPAMDAAVEEELINRNPFRSEKLEIGGRDTIHHRAIPKKKIEALREALPDMQGPEQLMFALLCYTGMRFEEVLGIKWEDYDGEWLHIERAVIHPTRNQPEIKPPKTKSSIRKIPCPDELKTLLGDPEGRSGYMVCAPQNGKQDTPLSYSEARNAFNRIKRRFHLEDYSAHDFRDTCATEWREKGIPLDIIARLLGHSKTQTTEQRYVKYRDGAFENYRDMM